jgi:hypothetical protein
MPAPFVGVVGGIAIVQRWWAPELAEPTDPVTAHAEVAHV